MKNYQPLTKIITDELGNQSVACALLDTKDCQKLHKNGCATCPMLAAMMNQLHTFEEIYMED